MNNIIVISETDLASRTKASQYRAKILPRVVAGEMVVVDLQAVQSISDSFADELFGVLVLTIGLEKFAKQVHLENVQEHLYKVIALNIHHRLESSKSAA